MPWNIIILPVLLCLVYGIKQGLKTKEEDSLPFNRRTSWWE